MRGYKYILLGLGLLSWLAGCGPTDGLGGGGAGSNQNGSDGGDGGGGTGSGQVEPFSRRVLTLDPPISTMLGDTSLDLTVHDPQDRKLDWVFEIRDLEDEDNDDLGQVQIVREDPVYLIRYTAPKLQKILHLEIDVIHPDDDEQRATASITVLPAEGRFIITPTDPQLGLNLTLQFSAAYEVYGIVSPLTNVHWRINGVAPPSAVFGDITRLGAYQAPSALPPLASSPTVGYALTREGPEVATTDVLLAELILDQKEFHSIKAGVVGKITGKVNYSDGTSANVGGADLGYSSDYPAAADVDAMGNVVIGNLLGRATITVTDKKSGAVAYALAFSRTDVKLVAEVERWTDDIARIDRTDASGVSFIEFTRPGPVFGVEPRVILLRGQRAGMEYSGLNNANVSMRVDGDILTYDSSKLEHEPDSAGHLATLDLATGKVRIGDLPGRGEIIIVFDDGFVHHEATLMVQYSQLAIELEALSSKSNQIDAAYITEHMNFNVRLINPSDNSDFIGRTPLQVTLGDGSERMIVYYGINIMTTDSDHNFRRNWHEETEAFTLRVPTNLLPQGGASRFALGPRRLGMHTVRVISLDDPGVQETSLDFDVLQPKLAVQYKNGVEIPQPAGSYVDIHQDPTEATLGVGLLDQYLQEDKYHNAYNDEPIWTVAYRAPLAIGDTTVTEYRLIPENPSRFPLPLENPGKYTVTLGFKDHPELISQPVEIQAYDPGDVGYPVKPLLDSYNKSISRSMQLGAFRLKEPFDNSWAAGAPLQVVVQTYDAEGVPKTVGHTARRVSTSGGDTTVTESDHVIGLGLTRVSGPGFTVDGSLWPTGASGEIVFNIIVQPFEDDDVSDLVLKLEPRIYQFSGDTYASPLPVQTIKFLNGAFVGTEGTESAIAEFENPDDKISYEHCVLISGKGLLITPRQLPVASQRLRDSIGKHASLPAGSEHVTFRVTGNRDFQQDLASGFASANLGTGMSVVSTSVDGQYLVITASTTIGMPMRERSIKLAFASGNTWRGTIDLFDNELLLGTQHSDVNLALNARHHDAHPPGSQVFIVYSPSFTTVPTLEAKVHPSLKPGDTFRGADVLVPLIGFRRERLPDGLWWISHDTIMVHQKDNPDLVVVGDIADRRTLNRLSNTLSAPGTPDHMADFVSPKKDAEMITLGLGGNLSDCWLFTAYNVLAVPEGELPDPGLGFDQLKSNIGNAYSKYSDIGGDTAADAAIAEQAQSIKVYVDHEANGLHLDYDKNRLDSPLFTSYFAGLLDQYYLWNGRTNPSFREWMLGQDGRVRAYNGDRGENLNVTGVDRKAFGLELDGVIYDPTLAGIDASPNASSLRNNPVVYKAADGDDLTENDLVPEQGGTSGGYFDLSERSLGSYEVVAKTPGAEFPGLDTGYLIEGKPGDLLDPWTNQVEDDISDVVIKRKVVPGGKISNDNETQFGFKKHPPKKILGLNNADDQKAPIRTAIRERLNYKIVTDPVGVDGVRICAAILIREKPLETKDLLNLVVTTRSTGNEGITKGVLDAVVGFIADMTKSIVLTIATDGYCGGELGAETIGNLTTAIINIGVGAANNQYIEPYVGSKKAESLDMVNGMLHDGYSVAPFISGGIQVSATDIVNSDMFYEEIEDWRDGFDRKKVKLPNADSLINNTIPKLGICALLGTHFENMKDAVKGSFSIEDLGGNGSAVAFGTRVLGMGINADDRLEATGTYSVVTSLTRRVDIVPGEENHKSLEEDYPEFFKDAAFDSDMDLLEQVVAKLDDPQLGAKARELMIKMAVNSVYRDTSDGTYNEYRMRYAKLLPLNMLVIPGKTVSNFEFKTNESSFPVISSAMVTATRSNQNATARASVSSNGIEVILIHAVVSAKKNDAQPQMSGRSSARNAAHSCGYASQEDH